MIQTQIEKGILFLAAALLFIRTGVHTQAVLAVLLLIVLTGVVECISNKKIKSVVFGLFCVLSMFLKEMSFFYPVTIYIFVIAMGAESQTEEGEGKALCPQVLYGVPAALMFVYLLYFIKGCELFKIMLWLVLCFLSFYFGFCGIKRQKLKYELIQTRDTGMERNLILKEKNRLLIENINNEIYLATLKERNRIAREIHDNVGHMLSRSILQVGAMSAIEKDETAKAQLQSINDTLNQAMDSIRTSVHDLHDDSVDLEQAVLDIVQPMKKTYQIRLDYDMSRLIPRNVKYCMIALTKEALSNIVRHSDADSITIVMREHPGFYQVSIEDNGNLTPEKKKAVQNRQERGMGLSNIQERVNVLGGICRIHAGQGVRVFASIPKEQLKGQEQVLQ